MGRYLSSNFSPGEVTEGTCGIVLLGKGRKASLLDFRATSRRFETWGQPSSLSVERSSTRFVQEQQTGPTPPGSRGRCPHIKNHC
jgi:hypothetical protein